MENAASKPLAKLIRTILVAIVLTLLYVLWTHTLVTGNILVVAFTALIIAYYFVSNGKAPVINLKKIYYSLAYILYLFEEIVKSNFDVARRVVQQKIPINPGIVKVKTRLKSPVGRMILANSITLTPGTLSVDVHDDEFFIHWIDVTNLDEEGASKKIVSGFEKYLEVIFG